ncbi:MAG TPA: TraR/DksA C4-type zinc finger protein [Lacipirellulaceae bacterium]|nr:TraR/DksA C4-type zinc finger protein [Lacipirellulaceae bacterium]
MKSDQTRSGDAWTVGARPLVFVSCDAVFSYELTCRNCGWRTVCGRDDAVARLRLIGLLRRERDPNDGLVETLFVEAAPRMTCPICKEKSLFARHSDNDESNDWQVAALCEICREPIPLERLEAVPGTKRCADCARKAEAGQQAEIEPDFCPHCGALIDVRVSRTTGITRYKRVCTGDPPCRL